MQFGEVVGHETLKATLRRSADAGRVSHAQLFTGASGAGVLPLALAYAQYLQCTARLNGDSCGECPACRKMAGLVHPDLHFVFPVGGGTPRAVSDPFLDKWRATVTATGGYFDEAAWYAALGMDNKQGLISKAEADEVLRKLAFKPFEGTWKIMIVWLPERMRTEAANSLLKILEEPWERTVFLLVSAAPELLLDTIRSRTQQVAVPGVAEADAVAWAGRTLGVEPERAAAAARLAGGDLIRMRRLLAEEGVSEHFDAFVRLMRFSYNDRHMELIEWAEGAASQGREQQKALLREVIRLLRESYMLHAGMERIVSIWGEELEFCRKFSPFVGGGNIESLVAETESALRQIARNGNPRIVLIHYALTVSKLIGRVQP